MITDPINFLPNLNIDMLIKITSLVFIGMYAVFSFMLTTKIRSFNKILFLPPNSGGSLMQRIMIVYTITVAVLFLFALVML